MTPISVYAWLLAAWLAVTGALLAFTALALFRLRRMLRKAEPLSDPVLREMAQEAAAAIGIRTVPRLLITQEEVSVLAVGAWNPAVLISQQALSACSPSELKLVLAHEFAHIRRGDAWLGLMPHLTQILFCFHPLAWLACRELNLARETACDEQTLRSLPVRPDLYGRLLLKLGVRHGPWLAHCTPGVSSHFRTLHRRISMLAQISEGSSRRRGSVVLIACLLGAALLVPWNLVRAQNPAVGGAADAAPNRAGTSGPSSAAGDTDPNDGAQASVKPGNPRTNMAKKAIAFLPGKPASPGNGKPAGPVKKNAPPAGTLSPGSGPARPADRKPNMVFWGREGGVAPEMTTHTFRLRYAQAESVARTLETLFGDKEKSVKIVPDARTNMILLQASDEKATEIVKILRELDTEAPENPNDQRGSVRILPLKYARAADISVILSKLFEDKVGKTAHITADRRTNSLIIQAGEEQSDKIINVLRELDIAPK